MILINRLWLFLGDKNQFPYAVVLVPDDKLQIFGASISFVVCAIEKCIHQGFKFSLVHLIIIVMSIDKASILEAAARFTVNHNPAQNPRETNTFGSITKVKPAIFPRKSLRD